MDSVLQRNIKKESKCEKSRDICFHPRITAAKRVAPIDHQESPLMIIYIIK